ncbi:hypothetical protein NP245_23950 [Salmonella enterica]|nr:hypothetical protein [Salmonella enterica]MCQ7855554.1 hypothetical protein [Salmonella enterica]
MKSLTLRSTETSVGLIPLGATHPALEGLSILSVASMRVNLVDSEIVIIPTRHITVNAHLHQKKRIAQMRPQNPLVITLTLTPAGAIDTLIITVSMDTTPMDHIPTDHIPMDHIPTDHIPTDHIPTDHIPTGTRPMATTSTTMVPVTHPPMAENSKVTVVMATAVHMTVADHTITQGKEVRAKDAFLSITEKSEMFIDSHH